MKIKNVHIFGGGTFADITNHLALAAPAFGWTANKLYSLVVDRFKTMNIIRDYTLMAGGRMRTNEDVAKRIEELKVDVNTKVIFFNCALVDFRPTSANYNHAVGLTNINIGKDTERLETRHINQLEIRCASADKVIGNIRKGRKDIFLVGFKATCGATKREMYLKGLRLCKESSVNLVYVNDTKTKWNMIVTPEEAAYHEGDNAHECLKALVDMAFYRSHLTFTQSTVVEGKPIAWQDERVPASLRTVVDHAIKGNAYKVFNNSTVGHFAVRLSDTEFLTSIRKSNFNKLNETGLVYVKTDGPDTVLAYGAKPSVGGQSQRKVFRDHPGMDCIVHFHCPLRQNHPDDIPIRSQREVECGSHQCGENTSQGLKQFGSLKAVMLDQHGPNIVFNKDIDPQQVIDFIERNFDLTKKTGGYNLDAT